MPNCPQCNQPILVKKRQFCSRTCRNRSLIRRISLKCVGCNIIFHIKPYLKRKTNYCSVMCYHKSTNKKVRRKCIVCNRKFLVKEYLIKKGFGQFCSLKCLHLTYQINRKIIICKQCRKNFKKPSSVAKKKPNFCSKKCHDDFVRDYEICTCLNCHKQFEIPTWETNRGKGRFCSRRCFVSFQGESTIEMIMRQALEKKGISFQQEAKFGKYHADFFLPEQKIVIECDGGYWHEKPQFKAKDEKKNLFLSDLGYKVFRFTGSQIRKSAADCLEQILV